MAEAPHIFRIFGRVTFEVSAREIVEEHFVLGLKERAPALREVIKERGFMVWKLVVALVEVMDFGKAEVPAQKVGQGAMIKPVPMELPLTAGANETIKRKHLEDLIPARPLAADGQPVLPEGVEPELLPEQAPHWRGRSKRIPDSRIATIGTSPCVREAGTCASGKRATWVGWPPSCPKSSTVLRQDAS